MCWEQSLTTHNSTKEKSLTFGPGGPGRPGGPGSPLAPTKAFSAIPFSPCLQRTSHVSQFRPCTCQAGTAKLGHYTLSSIPCTVPFPKGKASCASLILKVQFLSENLRAQGKSQFQGLALSDLPWVSLSSPKAHLLIIHGSWISRETVTSEVMLLRGTTGT